MRGCTCHGDRTLCPWCTQLAQRAGGLARPETPSVTEKAFQAAVVRLARAHGWYAYHTHDSRRSLPGYPDLTLCHPSGNRPVIWAELKIPGGQLTLQQHAWLRALTLAEGKDVYTWQPDNWALIEARLRS